MSTNKMQTPAGPAQGPAEGPAQGAAQGPVPAPVYHPAAPPKAPAASWPEGWTGSLDGRGPGSPLANLAEHWDGPVPEGLEDDQYRYPPCNIDHTMQLLEWCQKVHEAPELFEDQRTLQAHYEEDNAEAHWRNLSGGTWQTTTQFLMDDRKNKC